jgi:hypothetical protein
MTMLINQLKLLTENELNFVKIHKHIPNALLLVLHAKDLYKALQDKKITTYQQGRIDNTLTSCVMLWENVNVLKKYSV